MHIIRTRPYGQDWLDQIFRAKSEDAGGVVRRKIANVAREVGMGRPELEVRRCGCRMVSCGNYVAIFCSSEAVQIIC